MKKGVRVLLEEEYGYRYWIWNTEMEEEELIAWFKENIGKNDDAFFDPRSLSGRKKCITGTEYRSMSRGSWIGMFHTADDSYLISPKGTVYSLIKG